MNALENRIYLASRSPRRRELLKQIGINFEVLIMRSFPTVRADVDETPGPGESPGDYVTRIAANKAMTGWTRHSPGPFRKNSPREKAVPALHLRIEIHF